MVGVLDKISKAKEYVVGGASKIAHNRYTSKFSNYVTEGAKKAGGYAGKAAEKIGYKTAAAGGAGAGWSAAVYAAGSIGKIVAAGTVFGLTFPAAATVIGATTIGAGAGLIGKGIYEAAKLRGSGNGEAKASNNVKKSYINEKIPRGEVAPQHVKEKKPIVPLINKSGYLTVIEKNTSQPNDFDSLKKKIQDVDAASQQKYSDRKDTSHKDELKKISDAIYAIKKEKNEQSNKAYREVFNSLREEGRKSISARQDEISGINGRKAIGGKQISDSEKVLRNAYTLLDEAQKKNNAKISPDVISSAAYQKRKNTWDSADTRVKTSYENFIRGQTKTIKVITGQDKYGMPVIKEVDPIGSELKALHSRLAGVNKEIIDANREIRRTGIENKNVQMNVNPGLYRTKERIQSDLTNMEDLRSKKRP